MLKIPLSIGEHRSMKRAKILTFIESEIWLIDVRIDLQTPLMVRKRRAPIGFPTSQNGDKQKHSYLICYETWTKCRLIQTREKFCVSTLLSYENKLTHAKSSEFVEFEA